MKKYQIFVDGYSVGVSELTPQEVQMLNKDKNIKIKKVK